MAGHIPQPFKRPSVDLGKAKRSWQTVGPERIEPGDLIPDLGTVDRKHQLWNPELRCHDILFENAHGRARRHRDGDLVFAFVKEV